MSDPRGTACASPENTECAPTALRAVRRCWRATCARGPLIASVAATFFWFGQFAGAVQKNGKILRADAVVAERIELVRSDGKLAALLYTNERDSTMLTFYDAKEKARLSVGFAALGQPALVAYDTKGDQRMSLELDADGYPGVHLVGDASFGPRASLYATKDSTGVYLGSETSGKAWMTLDETGQPEIRLTGAGKERQVYMTADQSGPAISLTGKDQSVDLRAGDAAPRISLIGKKDTRRIDWTLPPNGPPAVFVADDTGKYTLIMTLDNDGKPTWRQLPQ
jgi:hypothetical protein